MLTLSFDAEQGEHLLKEENNWHPSIHFVTQKDSCARTKVHTYCSGFVFGFCISFSCVTNRLCSPNKPNTEFAVRLTLMWAETRIKIVPSVHDRVQ
jgi:hypothetical protein